MNREAHVQFWERAEVQFLRATRPAMESFWSNFKTETEMDIKPPATRATARLAIFDHIETFYNPKRRHSSLGYLSPVAFELNTQKLTASLLKPLSTFSRQAQVKPLPLLAAIALVLFGCSSKPSHQYKLTLEMQRSFFGPVMFDAQWSGDSGVLHVVALERPSAEGLGKIFHDEKVSLSGAQIGEIESLLAKVDRSLEGRVPGGLDGTVWSLTADAPTGSYRIESWTPSIHSKERRTEGVQALGEYLWKAAALEGEKVY